METIAATMKFRDAVISILQKSKCPLTPQQIRDELIRHHPHLYDTPAQRESVRRKHQGALDHALLAQIYTFVGNDPRFAKDESVSPYLVSLASAENDAWTDEELRASVECYLDMRDKIFAGEPVVKAAYYQHLADQFGHTSKAFEYRMQNISYVLSVMGRAWIPGPQAGSQRRDEHREKDRGVHRGVGGEDIRPGSCV